MKIEIEITEEQLEELASLIAAKVGGSPAPAENDDDDLAGAEKEKGVELSDVQDEVRRAAGVDKEKTKKVLGKYKAARASELKEGDYEAAMKDLAKIK